MNTGQYVATCFFMDVGSQRSHSASSTVILLFLDGPENPPNAVIIDCGGESQTTLKLLRDFGVVRIPHVIITHNDEDHCAGLLTLVEEYHQRKKKQLGSVWLLQDRPAPDIRYLKDMLRLKAEQAFGELQWLAPQLNRTPRLLCQFPFAPGPDIERRLSIELLYPLEVEDTVVGQLKKEPNLTSAVLRLHYDGRVVLFPGDAPISTLRKARNYFAPTEPRPIRCDVLAVPHHGGLLASAPPSLSELVELYTQIVTCNFAILSVATHNLDGHPRSDHIQALKRSCRHVLCTQITGQCCNNDLAAVQAGVLPADPRVAQASDQGPKYGTPCAGTVVVDIGSEPLQPRRYEEHQRQIDLTVGQPLCRTRASAAEAEVVDFR